MRTSPKCLLRAGPRCVTMSFLDAPYLPATDGRIRADGPTLHYCIGRTREGFATIYRRQSVCLPGRPRRPYSVTKAVIITRPRVAARTATHGKCIRAGCVRVRVRLFSSKLAGVRPDLSHSARTDLTAMLYRGVKYSCTVCLSACLFVCPGVSLASAVTRPGATQKEQYFITDWMRAASLRGAVLSCASSSPV